MAYRVKRKVFKLVFVDGEAAGLEVTSRGMLLGEARALLDSPDSETGMQMNARVDVAMMGRLTEWNAEAEDGSPLPLSVDALDALTFGAAEQLRTTWLAQCLGQEVPRPLSTPSSDGESSGRIPAMEVSLATESLPTSLAS